MYTFILTDMSFHIQRKEVGGLRGLGGLRGQSKRGCYIVNAAVCTYIYRGGRLADGGDGANAAALMMHRTYTHTHIHTHNHTIYIYVYVCTYLYTHTCIYIYRRERWGVGGDWAD